MTIEHASALSDGAKAPAPDSGPLDEACKKLVGLRKSPLLVLFYPPSSRVTESDLEDTYRAFREAGLNPEQKLPRLDVLLESYGGDPVAGYRLAQLVRSFATGMDVLVAEHAYSAATLFSFAADQVRLAHFAGLSPIDITLSYNSPDRPQREIELATLDSVIEFAANARKRIERLLRELDSDSGTTVDSDVIVSVVEQVGALEVGKIFRERALTGHYAEELLGSYMFAKRTNRRDCCNHVITNFLFGAPSHSLHLDFKMARKWGLAVREMPTSESDLAKGAVEALERMAGDGSICPWFTKTYRQPFVAYYPVAQSVPVKPKPAAAPAAKRGILSNA